MLKLSLMESFTKGSVRLTSKEKREFIKIIEVFGLKMYDKYSSYDLYGMYRLFF